MLEKRTNATYLTIMGGNIAQKVPEGTEGATQRTNKNGKQVYEMLYKSVSGRLQSAVVESGNYGDQLKVTIDSEGRKCILTIPVQSAYFSNFASKIGNVDLSKDVKIYPYSLFSKEKNKQISGLNFYQNDKKIEYFISNENRPDGYPAMPEKGKDAEFKKFLIDKTEWEKSYVPSLFDDIGNRKVPMDEVGDFLADGISDSEVPF